MRRKIICILSSCLLLSSCAKVDEVSQKVMTDIDSIGTVELSDQELIEKVENTYATLTDKQKEQVDNYAVLLTARDELDILLKEAEEKRIADEKAAEEARIAEEKAAEEKRIADEKAAAEERKKQYTHSVKYCAKAIITLKSELKNPDSLDIHAFHYSDTNDIEYVGIDASAQNGFGGVNRKCYLVTDSTELILSGIPNLDTFMYCIENEYTTSDSIKIFDEYDDVDSEIVYQLLADYEETGDDSLLRG